MTTDPSSTSSPLASNDPAATAPEPAAADSSPNDTGGEAKRGPLAAPLRPASAPRPAQSAPARGGQQRGGSGGKGPAGDPRRNQGSRSPGPQRGPQTRSSAPSDVPLTAEQQEQADEDAAREAAQDREVRKAKTGPVPVPSRRAKLSDEIEAEISAMLGDVAMDEAINTRPVTAGRLENESRHRAQVVEVHNDDVFFSLGGKNQGVCSARNFETPPEVGAMLDVIVTGYDAENGLHDLAVPGGSLAATSVDWSSIAEGSLVEARVTAANTGGLEAVVNGIRAFIPASQTGVFRTENMADFVGQKFVCVVTEANERRGNLVLSRRAVLEREKEESKKQLLKTLQVGDMREGVVRKLHDFGAFCDLGGVDGLIHVSQLSWERVKHPSEVVKEGQKVRVRIEKIDAETGKISLSLKNPEEHPWTGIEDRFPVGTTVRGTVSRIAEFGAFVKLAPGVEGLIHISELAHQRVYAVKNVVKEGEEVEAKVISVDAEAQRMSLSLKAAIAKPAKEEKKAEGVAEPDAPPRPLAVAKHQGPLKGGTKNKSGGEKFGLNW